MTPEQKALREAVARAMVAKDSGPDGSTLFEVHWREFGEGYLSGADAAIAVALERAAEVIETRHTLRLGTDKHVSESAKEDAAAIRALKGKP